MVGLNSDPADAGDEVLCHRPFDKYCQIGRDAAKDLPFFRDNYGFGGTSPDPQEWRRIDDDWLEVAGPLALRLDSDTNNTSLVLAVELVESGKVLLFPGDAQVGNWLSWEKLSWSVPGGRGESVTVTAADLLRRIVLYKVGHHGSHNATLREKGLELMNGTELTAMIPVDEAAARNKGWTRMPFLPLLKRLEEKTGGRILRSDRGPAGLYFDYVVSD